MEPTEAQFIDLVVVGPTGKATETLEPTLEATRESTSTPDLLKMSEVALGCFEATVDPNGDGEIIATCELEANTPYRLMSVRRNGDMDYLIPAEVLSPSLGDQTQPFWFPNGDLGVLINTTVYRWDGTTAMRLVQLPKNSRDVTVAPSGEHLALIIGGCGGDLFTVNLDGTGMKRVATGDYGKPTWTSDDELLVLKNCWGPWEQLVRLNIKTGEEEVVISQVWDYELSSTDSIAVSSHSILPVSGVYNVSGPTTGYLPMKWSPDGSMLVYSDWYDSMGLVVSANDGLLLDWLDYDSDFNVTSFAWADANTMILLGYTYILAQDGSAAQYHLEFVSVP